MRVRTLTRLMQGAALLGALAVNYELLPRLA